MYRQVFLLGAATLAVALTAAAQLNVGSAVPDFKLQDVAGREVSYSSLKGDTTVLTFIATKCPISNDYNERMKAIYNDYAAKGVKFVFINSNATEPAEDVASHSKSNGFAFSVYKDHGNVVADTFGAQVTPESYVIDKSGTIRYHGYIDDSRNAANVKNQGLRLAIDAVMAGRAVPNPQTKAFGCTIKRAKKTT